VAKEFGGPVDDCRVERLAALNVAWDAFQAKIATGANFDLAELMKLDAMRVEARQASQMKDDCSLTVEIAPCAQTKCPCCGTVFDPKHPDRTVMLEPEQPPPGDSGKSPQVPPVTKSGGNVVPLRAPPESETTKPFAPKPEPKLDYVPAKDLTRDCPGWTKRARPTRSSIRLSAAMAKGGQVQRGVGRTHQILNPREGQ
jgi:hypothetical protein